MAVEAGDFGMTEGLKGKKAGATSKDRLPGQATRRLVLPPLGGLQRAPPPHAGIQNKYNC